MSRIIQVLCFASALLLPALRASVSVAQADPRAQARAHFDKGRAAWDAGDLDEAVSEFEQAHQLSPEPVVLYNLGQINIARERPVEAVEDFERYLEEGGKAVPPTRQREVRAAIIEQTARIGTVAIFVRPDGAEVRVDGQLLGATPLGQPLRLAAGAHTIEVTRAEYIAAVRKVLVTRGEQLNVPIDLVPTSASRPSDPSQPSAASQASTASLSRSAAPTGSVPVPPSVSSSQEHVDTQPSDRQKIAGYVVGGAGVVAAGIGLTLALASAGQATNALQRLERAQSGAAWDDAKSDFDSAKDDNRIGWIVFGSGVAGVIAGAILVLTAPTPPSADLHHLAITPWVLPASAGVYARSSW